MYGWHTGKRSRSSTAPSPTVKIVTGTSTTTSASRRTPTSCAKTAMVRVSAIRKTHRPSSSITGAGVCIRCHSYLPYKTSDRGHTRHQSRDPLSAGRMRALPFSTQPEADESEAGGNVMMNRREFCKKAMIVVGGIRSPLYRPGALQPKETASRERGSGKVRWAFLVDTTNAWGADSASRHARSRTKSPMMRK